MTRIFEEREKSFIFYKQKNFVEIEASKICISRKLKISANACKDDYEKVAISLPNLLNAASAYISIDNPSFYLEKFKKKTRYITSTQL